MNLLKITFFLTIILLLSTAWASTVTIQSYDLNQDGVKDRFEYSVNERVIRVEEDRDGDKKIDFKTVLDDKVYYKIEWQNSAITGKPERKQSYLKLPQNKTRIITEVDKDGDAVFEIRYETIVDDLQKQDHCGEVNAKIRQLSDTSLKAVSKTDKGLLPTGLGYKVDYECYSKWGDDFNKIIKEVAVGGLQCLMDLDKANRTTFKNKTSGAAINAFGITKLMKNDGISLICSETDYNWAGTGAHASTKPYQVMESKKITHPFVSLNPAYPENTEANRTKEIEYIKATIFHETLHNLGILHEENIEFAYTCGKCCFNNKDDKAELKDMACKICTGNYKNVTDINYVKDFVEFSQMNAQQRRGTTATIQFLKENDKSTSGLAILAYATSGVFNPVGDELAKLISSKHNDLTIDDQMYLANASKYATQVEFKSLQITSKTLSATLYELYYNKSGASAMGILEKNKDQIKAELEKMKTGTGNSVWVQEDTKAVLDRIINDVWLNKYPDGSSETSQRAYELFNFFK